MALELIGAGFGRTGTASMKAALEMIGYGPCYHMIEVFPDPKAPAFWARAARGEAVNWDEIFEGYKATVDWPACTYWRELADHYPDAKVLLTVRDADKWFDSTQATIFNPNHIDLFLQSEDVPADLRELMDRLYTKTFHGRGREREHAKEVFRAHNEAVKESIDPDRLLVYEVGQGWEPLCKFLGAPVPDEPFPHINTSEEWAQRGAPSGVPME